MDVTYAFFFMCCVQKAQNRNFVEGVKTTQVRVYFFITGWICTAWRGWWRRSTTKWRRGILIGLESSVCKTVVAVKSLEWTRTWSILIMCTANFTPKCNRFWAHYQCKKCTIIPVHFQHDFEITCTSGVCYIRLCMWLPIQTYFLKAELVPSNDIKLYSL